MAARGADYEFVGRASVALHDLLSGATRVNKPVTGSTDFNRGAAHEKLTSDQLEQLTNAFADRYRTLMEDAVREIVRGNKDARQRAVAQRMLVETTSSVYDIASNGDPFSQVLDLTIVVTLTSQVWIDGDRATREFGPEHAEPMITALRQARKEVWEIAGKVFLPDQLSALDFLIAGWRRDNPKVEDVAYVRFNDFAESRGEKIVEEAASGGGLFEPLDKAVEQAKNYERLGERIFFLAKRLPTLASWQSEAVVDEIIAKGTGLAADALEASEADIRFEEGRFGPALVEIIDALWEPSMVAD
jgi:hypothetical protein